MLLLTDKQSLYDFAGLQVQTARDANVDATIANITPKIEGTLRTKLSRSEDRIDYFSVKKAKYADTPSSVTLLLSRGFVDPDCNITLCVHSSGNLHDPSVNGTMVDDVEYDVDYEKGRITLYTGIYVGRNTISVEYSSGFDADTNTNLIVDGPEWLKEAALVLGTISLSADKTSSHNAKYFNNLHVDKKRNYDQLVSPYIRSFMGSNVLSPTRTDNG